MYLVCLQRLLLFAHISSFLNIFCSSVEDETDVGEFDEELRKMLMKCSSIEMSFEMICSQKMVVHCLHALWMAFQSVVENLFNQKSEGSETEVFINVGQSLWTYKFTKSIFITFMGEGGPPHNRY